jgi:hypothetical protein
MSLNTNEIIKTTQELQAAQEVVRALEEKLRGLVMEPERLNSGINKSSKLSVVLGLNQSLGDRVKAFLCEKPEKDFTFQEILGFVGGNEPYLRSLLSRMMKDKTIETRGWGLYGAISENTSEKEERLKAE